MRYVMTVKTANLTLWRAINFGIWLIALAWCLYWRLSGRPGMMYPGVAVLVVVYGLFIWKGRDLVSGETTFTFLNYALSVEKGGKKRLIPYSSFVSVKAKPLKYNVMNPYPVGYRVRLVTNQGFYTFESDFADRREFKDMDLYKVHMQLVQTIEKINRGKR